MRVTGEFMECTICEAEYRKNPLPGQTFTVSKPYYKTYITLHEPECPLRFKPEADDDDE